MSYHSGSSSSARRSSTSARSSTTITPSMNIVQPQAPVVRARPIVTAQPETRPVAPPGYHYMPNGNLMLDSQMKSQTPATRIVTPPGYHYMPDGSLMSDVEHKRMLRREQAARLSALKTSDNFYNPYETSVTSSKDTLKTIRSFVINTQNISEKGEQRIISISGESGAKFRLEIKNEAGLYYNFISNLLQASPTRLEQTLNSVSINITVNFPGVAAATQYDIFLFAGENTKHSNYVEYRFEDETLDVNASSGSNSLLMQKLIYQTLDVAFDIGAISINSLTAFQGAGVTNDVKNIPIGVNTSKVPFQISFKSGNTKAFKLKRQPTKEDIFVFATRNITTPSTIHGENIYPTATAAFTGDDINGAITSGAVVRMDNTDLSAVISVGDKITTPVITDTVNGARDASAVAVTMDSAVATKMAVGDQVTGNAALDAGIFTVASLDSTNVFSISSAVAIADGATLTFSSKINRSLTTVTVVETSSTDTVNGARDASAVAVTMDAAVASKMAVGDIVTGNTALDAGVFTVAAIASTNVFNLSSAVAIADGTTLTFRTATDFTMSQAIQFRDNAPLTFFNQMNHRWSVDDVSGINQGMIPLSPNITSGSTVGHYIELIKELEGTSKEKTRVLQRVPAALKDARKPSIARNASTKLLTKTQLGEITFDKQQKLVLAGDEFKLVGKGRNNIKSLVGWDVGFSNLKAVLSPVVTTTTQAVSASPTVTVASGDGIMDDVSKVSGIGINGNPLVTTLGSYSGTTATVTFSGVQTLENGISLTFHGSGEELVMTGDFEVMRSEQINPDWNGIFYFSVEDFVTATDET